MWIHDQLAISPDSNEWHNPFPLADNLLVSSPADRGYGGLLYLESQSFFKKGNIRLIDRLGSMGLCMNDEYLLRVVQPGERNGCIVQYHKSGTVWTMANAELAEVHDVIIFDGAVWVASTGTNEIVRLNWDGTTAQKIKLSGEPDSWHVNCFDVWNGKLVASCFGMFGKWREWKDNDKNNGVVFEVETQKVVWDGLTMPHMPRLLDDGTKVVCNSNEGTVVVLAPNGKKSVLDYSGYFTRGFAASKNFFYVGLSERRHTDAPIKEAPRGRVAVVDRVSLTKLEEIVLPFREVYDILILPS